MNTSLPPQADFYPAKCETYFTGAPSALRHALCALRLTLCSMLFALCLPREIHDSDSGAYFTGAPSALRHALCPLLYAPSNPEPDCLNEPKEPNGPNDIKEPYRLDQLLP